MTPTQIAQKIVNKARSAAKHPSLMEDSLIRELANAISTERELISRYLQFLNESIAGKPELVRHRLLTGSTRIENGSFVEDMQPDEKRQYNLRLNPIRTAYYSRS